MIKHPAPSFSQRDRKESVLRNIPNLEQIFVNHAESRHIPGAAYGVILDGELVCENGLGVCSLSNQEKASADTIFRIASMTKSFAAVAIMQLRDAARLSLDEPAATYVPELADLVYPSADLAPITVRQLLSMNAGWPQDDPWADRQLYQTDAALSDFYRAGVSWSNPPGNIFEYSNYGYMVLGRIITNVSEMPAIDYITQKILQPLGMNDTVWHAGDVPSERLALGYRWEDEQWKPEELLPTGGDVAAFAGLLTTVRDLTHWVDLFLSAWPPRDASEAGEQYRAESTASTVLSSASLREMQRIWTASRPSIEQSSLGADPKLVSGGYGFGLSLQHNGKWIRVGHGGGLPGFGTYMCWAPEYGIGVVALSNVTNGAMSIACIKAIELLLDEQNIQPRTLPVSPALAAAQEQLIELVYDWDDELADELFADNFLLDLDKEHWLQRFAELAEKHGALAGVEPIIPRNWLRGTWRMMGEHGWCDFFISLSPTVPPRIQTLKIDSTLPPSTELEASMNAVAALITKPTKGELKRLCGTRTLPNDDVWEELWDQVRLAHILCGESTIGEVTGGDGENWCRFDLVGAKRTVDVRLDLNERGKVSKLSFKP